MALIEFHGLTKKFPEVGITALDDIDLEVEKGDFLYILGTTGAGKTTLLGHIYRDYQPTTGQILVDGRNIASLDESEVPDLRRRIGVVFQDFKLLEDRSVFDNVAISLVVRGEDPHEIERRVMRALDQVGLKDRRDQDPRTLSGGEAQRVSLARALVKEPEIVLADEPTGNLDPGFSDDIMDLLHDINDRGTTLLMATHDYETIARYPNTCYELKDGQLHQREHPSGHQTGEGFSVSGDTGTDQ